MRRKYICVCLIAVTLLLLSLEANAQVGQLYGKVSSKLASGETIPIEGATIDAFRTDIASMYHTTTDKTGEFIFAGLPYVGTYILAVSAPNSQPEIISNVKAGRDIEYKITLEPGDGRRLTLEEAKKIAKEKDQAAGTETEGQGIPERQNEIINRAFRAGNEALAQKNFDEAIKQYDEGINADPTHPGVADLLTNKSAALRARAIASYNTSIFVNGKAANASGMEAIKKDFRDAADAAARAVELIKAQPIPTEEGALRNYNNNKYFALAARAEAMRLLVKVVDPKLADTAFSAFQEYIDVETDPAKKTKAQLDAARMLLDANLTDSAIEEFRRILITEPENIDAMLGIGQAIYKSGNRDRFSEAANYLQRFIEDAPDTHPAKQTAKEILQKLKPSN
ncbi:MAG TPA: carboxypeptidase-like regulatory domain-containing protein [Pyrinomonadaceae bacterium]